MLLCEIDSKTIHSFFLEKRTQTKIIYLLIEIFLLTLMAARFGGVVRNIITEIDSQLAIELIETGNVNNHSDRRLQNLGKRITSRHCVKGTELWIR